MIYTVSLSVALTIFLAGCLYRCWRWFCLRIGDSSQGEAPARRLRAAFGGMAATFFSWRIVVVAWEFLVNVLLQWKILKEDRLRWLTHMLIFLGFALLFFLHAIDGTYDHPFFKVYYTTLDPYLLLRNLFAAMVLAGVALAIYRRVKIRGMRRLTSAMDKYAIVMLAVIISSGVALEAAKIVSHKSFQRMLHEYVHPGLHITDHHKDPYLEALMAYWQEEHGVVFPARISVDDQKLALGEQMHDEYLCWSCHSKPSSAFVSYGTARLIRPAANVLTAANVEVWLWYIHFLTSFIGLAYLPFSKFFHIFSTPVSLLANAAMRSGRASSPSNIATRRAMELDACMHCATCSIRCSVGQIHRVMSNPAILPSEKLLHLKQLAAGRETEAAGLQRISEGAHICTLCSRCTNLCPAGINLQDLWVSIREDLARRGCPDPFVQAREASLQLRREESGAALIPSTPQGREMRRELGLSAQSDNFSSCYKCTTCTSECPVVACHDNPVQALGLLPHQIMHALALGLRNEALASRMVWDCVTCYSCQEACPQNVKVTDILYELRNIAYRDVRGKPPAISPPGRGSAGQA